MSETALATAAPATSAPATPSGASPAAPPQGQANTDITQPSTESSPTDAPEPSQKPYTLEDFPTDIAPIPEGNPDPEPTDGPDSALPEPNGETVEPVLPDTLQPRQDALPDGFPPEYAGLLKKMAKDARAVFVQEWQAKQDAAKRIQEFEAKLQQATEKNPQLPEAWYEADEAYRITPEYNAAAAELHSVNGQADFIRQQLAAVKRGEKFFIPGVDQQGNVVPCVYKNGALVQSSEGMEPTAEAETYLLQGLAAAVQQQSQAAQKINGLRETFKAKHTQSTQELQGLLKANAPWAEKADDPRTKLATEVAQKLPAAYRKHPLAMFVGHAYAHASQAEQRAAAAEAKLKALHEGKQDTRRTLPPPAGQRTAPATAKAYTLADFQ